MNAVAFLAAAVGCCKTDHRLTSWNWAL